MKRGRPAISIGIVSLITVFTILLLAVFSVLSLSGSRSDSVLSDRAARAVSDYYLAEAQAEQKLLELSSIASNDTGTPLRERLEAAGFEISVDTPYPGTVVVYDFSKMPLAKIASCKGFPSSSRRSSSVMRAFAFSLSSSSTAKRKASTI
jgi:hypothetical protein